MLSSQSGVSDAPKPGCSGTIRSYFSASMSMNGSQRGTPVAPCRNSSGSPLPLRIMRMRQPVTVSNVS